MLNKRSQVTIFVILGIIIVMVLALVFYLYGNKLKVETSKQPTFDASQVEPLKVFVARHAFNLKTQRMFFTRGNSFRDCGNSKPCWIQFRHSPKFYLSFMSHFYNFNRINWLHC